MRMVLSCLLMFILPVVRCAAAEGTAEPPLPAPAADAERQLFCRDAAAHRLPPLVADAAATALGHGFHFDSYQALPSVAAPDPAPPVAEAVIYRIQVMDEQNQALEIRVPASTAGQPTGAVVAQWMCWMPATAATARRESPMVEARP